MVTDLIGKGSGPYVAVSRARSRFDFAIVREIQTLSDINHKPNMDLCREMLRIDALAHKHQIRHNPHFNETLVPVPDAESEVLVES